MLHGGFHSGDGYLLTPDGRPGWARQFALHGHTVFVPDWPAHGKSPQAELITALSTEDVAKAIAKLLDDIGPSIVLAHSAAGPVAWWLAEHHSHNVKAIVGVAPGSPGNLLRALPNDADAVAALRSDEAAGCPVFSAPDRPAVVDQKFIKEFWANGERFPAEGLEAYVRTVVPESPKILNERFNIGGAAIHVGFPQKVGARPILVLTGENDLRHSRPTDAALAEFLGADFTWLPDAGIHGNGHMLMLESNSAPIADLILKWIDLKGI
jgi:pimeloyl-ACP methyl ester carboxylesterase